MFTVYMQGIRLGTLERNLKEIKHFNRKCRDGTLEDELDTYLSQNIERKKICNA